MPRFAFTGQGLPLPALPRPVPAIGTLATTIVSIGCEAWTGIFLPPLISVSEGAHQASTHNSPFQLLQRPKGRMSHPSCQELGSFQG